MIRKGVDIGKNSFLRVGNITYYIKLTILLTDLESRNGNITNNSLLKYVQFYQFVY